MSLPGLEKRLTGQSRTFRFKSAEFEGVGWMKREIAKRKLKKTCIYCGRKFTKGDVYYRHRKVVEEDRGIYAFEYIECPKCRYKHQRGAVRRVGLQERCKHHITGTMYDYAWPGQIEYDYCLICEKVL
jgi:hypothetical protein